jgi:hypothetical protein
VFNGVTVRLYGMPAAISAAVRSFPRVEAAVKSVMRTIKAGLPVGALEIGAPALNPSSIAIPCTIFAAQLQRMTPAPVAT